MKKKYINWESLLEILSFIFLEAVLLWLIQSNTYQYYVTKKILPWLWIAVIIIACIIAASIPFIFLPKRKNHSLHLLAICIPAMIFILPKGDLSLASTNTQNILSGTTSSPQSESSTSSVQSSSTQEGYKVVSPSGNVAFLSGIDQENKKLTITHEEYYPWLTEIFMNPNKYLDYRISVPGFVFKGEEGLADNVFLLSRQLMTCCVSDLSTAGILVEYANTPSLTEKSWVLITGHIEVREIKGHMEPVLISTTLEETTPPDNPYITPF